MKYYRSFIFGCILFSIPCGLFAQDTLIQSSNIRDGISIEYGLGYFAVKDNYISKEKYSGALPYYRINWGADHGDYNYHLSMEFRYSPEINNYNVTADIYQFSLNQGFRYPLPKRSLFNRDVYLFLGPSTELFFYFNQQAIAVAGFDYAQSMALLLSLGASSQLVYKPGNHLVIESSLDFSLLSLGIRMVDSEESDESPLKLLSSFSGLNLDFRLGPRYDLTNKVSLKAEYLFQLTRISSWEPLLSASDTFVISLRYGF